MSILSDILTNEICNGLSSLLKAIMEKITDAKIQNSVRKKLTEAFQKIQGEQYYSYIDKYFCDANKVETLLQYFYELGDNVKPLSYIRDEIVKHIDPPLSLVSQIKPFILKVLKIIEYGLNTPHNRTERIILNNIKRGNSELAEIIRTESRKTREDLLKENSKYDSYQVLSLDEFISRHDGNVMVAPLNIEFQIRTQLLDTAIKQLNISTLLVLTGPSGVGKTRFAIEICRRMKDVDHRHVLCVRNFGPNLFEELRNAITPGIKYLLLVDDANEMSGLNYIFDYLTMAEKGFDVKAIFTVRDYVKKKIIQKAYDFCRPFEFVIKAMKNKEIKELVRRTFLDLSDYSLNQIARISKGNTRIAILAAQCVMHQKSLKSIQDASEFYDTYFGKHLTDSDLINSKNDLIVAAIIATLGLVSLQYLNPISELLREINIQGEEFVASAHRLHEMEFVDIYDDNETKISDQSFGNFIVKYIYIDKKYVSLDVIIKCCFSRYQRKIISLINMLVNVFRTEKVINNVTESVIKVWDEWNNDHRFDEFLSSFHMFRPIETLLYLNNRINQTPQENFDILSIDFGRYERNHAIHDKILDILRLYAYTEHCGYAMDLIMRYYEKRPSLYREVYHVLVDEFGIRPCSFNDDYKTQITVAEKIVGFYTKNKNIITEILFVRIAFAFLSLCFEYHELEDNDTLNLYQIPIRSSNGSRTYRKILWNALISYFDDITQKNILIEGLGYYPKNRHNMVDYDVIKDDIGYMKILFSDKLTPENLRHCIAAIKLEKTLKGFGVDHSNFLAPFFKSKCFYYYSLLEVTDRNKDETFDETERRHSEYIEATVSTFGKNEISDLLRFSSELEQIEGSLYDVQENLSRVFEIISNNMELYLFAIESYFQQDSPIGINAESAIRKLYTWMEPDEVYTFITCKEYKEKEYWIYIFFSTLPQEHIRLMHIEMIYSFYKNHPKPSRLTYRSLDFLDNYSSFDRDLLINICSILYTKNNDHNRLLYLYTSRLFNVDSKNASHIIHKFQNDFILLKNMYFVVSMDIYHDYHGKFLCELIKLYPGILMEYVEHCLQSESETDLLGRLKLLWDDENYVNSFTEIIDTIVSCENIFSYKKSSVISELLRNDREHVCRYDKQIKWLIVSAQ